MKGFQLTMIRSPLLISACIALNALLMSASCRATDLLEVYRLAQRQDTVLQSARYELESIQQKLPQAVAGLLPAISATGSNTDTHANTTFTDVRQVKRNNSANTWAVQLTQPLLRIENVDAYNEARHLVEQASATFAQAQQEAILRVAQAYFDVLVATESIAAADAQLRAYTEQLAQVTRGNSLGTHSITDMDETQSRLALARSQRVAALNDFQSKQVELEKITGESVDPLSALQPDRIPPAPQPASAGAWMNQARQAHPQVRAAHAAVEAAEAEVSKVHARALPTIDLIASYGKNSATHSLTTPNDFSTHSTSGEVGVQWTVPLFASGGRHAQTQEALAQLKKATADEETARRQAAAEAQQAYAGLINGLAQIDALKVAVESGRDAIKGNQEGNRVGLRVNLDVLNAEQLLFTAQRDLAKARYDTVLQGLKLKAAAGTLSEDDVVAVNALLVH